MENKPLISIAIPTYNRAGFLLNLLNQIVPQAKEADGLIEICISDNNSTDNTKELVTGFQLKYPGLITYRKNEKNMGFDVNFIKVVEMAQGDFVWLLGDDDMVVKDGLKRVLGFVRDNCGQSTGLVALGSRSYFVDKQTSKEMTYFNTIDQDKPKVYEISRDDVIRLSFPYSSFISILIFNNHFLKKVLKEEKNLIQEALVFRDYIQDFIYQLMFLKYPSLTATRCNEIIVEEQLHYYKFCIEDKFRLHYVAFKRLKKLLISSGYVKEGINLQNVSIKNFILEMTLMKAFEKFDYISFFGCLKMFFGEAGFLKASLLSAFFVILSITPSVFLKNFYKVYVRIKHKDWEKIWFYAITIYSEMAKGDRRQLS